MSIRCVSFLLGRRIDPSLLTVCKVFMKRETPLPNDVRGQYHSADRVKEIPLEQPAKPWKSERHNVEED
jgi:hypothetical protein